MRTNATNIQQRSGFTLAETLVAVAAASVVALGMVALLNSGMTLFARNVAINMAHQQARNGMMRVVRDLHQAVSIPQLVDASFNPVDAAGATTAGITFQIVANGPFQIINDPTAPALIQVGTTNPKPAAPSIGDHMVVLDYDVEVDITNITAAGAGSNHWNVFLKDGNETRIQTKSGSFVVCYITRRVGYVVNNSELRFYPNLVATPGTYSVVAHNITSPKPFSIPLNATGTPDTRYTSVNLTAMDPTYSNRGYKNTGMQLVDSRVPYRCQVTKYQ
jgi:prepilin-type N-terminal cleavage/methylation domain-containing protein